MLFQRFSGESIVSLQITNFKKDFLIGHEKCYDYKVNKTNSRTSNLVSGLRSSFSSGGGFGLGKNNQNPPAQQVDPNQVAQQTASTDQTQHLTQDQQLDTLSQVIDQVEAERDDSPVGAVAQAVPQAVQSIQDQLNPPNSTPVGAAKKEVYVAGPGLSAEAPAPTPEYPGGVQTVEQEKNPEISPEIESFLQQAKEQKDHLPQEIVVADNQAVSAVTHHPKTPVVVLPITEEDQKQGKKKSPNLSIRWLVEWSVKLMKKFSGKIIYREE